MPSKNDFFHYVGERLRSPEVTHFARERALLANTECLTVLAQLRIRHLESMSVLGPKADLARGATDVSSYLDNGHKIRKSNVMEYRVLLPPSCVTYAQGK
jgi:hypothetical protein